MLTPQATKEQKIIRKCLCGPTTSPTVPYSGAWGPSPPPPLAHWHAASFGNRGVARVTHRDEVPRELRGSPAQKDHCTGDGGRGWRGVLLQAEGPPRLSQTPGAGGEARANFLRREPLLTLTSDLRLHDQETINPGGSSHWVRGPSSPQPKKLTQAHSPVTGQQPLTGGKWAPGPGLWLRDRLPGDRARDCPWKSYGASEHGSTLGRLHFLKCETGANRPPC